jgi:hypothetical protein
MDRFRVQAYLTTQLGNHNTQQLNIGYAHQGITEKRTINYTTGKREYTYTNRQPLFMPSLRLHTNFLKNWNNDLSVAYVIQCTRKYKAVSTSSFPITCVPPLERLAGWNTWSCQLSNSGSKATKLCKSNSGTIFYLYKLKHTI